MNILLKHEQQVFFTSDTHYAHTNICAATTRWENTEGMVRDFQSLEAMNTTIVDNLNAVVGEEDILFHLGDWSFGGFEKIAEFRSRLVCKHVHIVAGNHDHHIERNKEGIQAVFSSVHSFIPSLEIKRPIAGGKGKPEKFKFCVFHYPIASWMGLFRGVAHLHGHVHLPSNLKLGPGRSLDVGVDGNDFKPYSLDEVMSLLKDQPIGNLRLSQDHHETNR